MEIANFFKTLFDEDDFVCFSENQFGTKVYHHSALVRERCQFFTINPLDPIKDNEPTGENHYPDRPRRADCNCIKYRNFLIEMDENNIEEQIYAIKKLQLPFTTAVFSGSKSIHWIISLETPLETVEEYTRWWMSFELAFRCIGIKIDRACKNPTRFSRVPGSINVSKGKVQELKKIKRRIKNEDILSWFDNNYVNPDLFKKKEEALEFVDESKKYKFGRSRDTKVDCPKCNHKNKFRLYIDDNGHRLDGYGKCDRENSCGYINYPKNNKDEK